MIIAMLMGMACTPTTLTSPDGSLELRFVIDDNGCPKYSLSDNKATIVGESKLGIVTSKEDLCSGLKLVKSTTSSENNTWQPVWGERESVLNNNNSLSVLLEKESGAQLEIEFKLFDDGLGIRYTLLGEGDADIISENTEFKMSGDHLTHWVAGNYDDNELKYMHTPLSGITPENMLKSAPGAKHMIECGVNLPVTMESSDNHFIAIHEAALWHYPAMSLEFDAESLTFSSSLAKNGDIAAHVTLPFSTPWRTIIVGDRAGDLVESTLILNLNEPCRIEDTSWIKPMKYVGVWWEMHLKESIWDRDGKYPHSATTENVKRYIDFAADNGFEGVLVEGWNVGWGWGERFDYTQPYPDFDIEELCSYARERDVVLIGHHETYANVENYIEQMDEAYAYYEELGIPSVKTGYVGGIRNHLHYDQWMVDHYNETVTKAAQHHLMVDIHEPVHPTGICRTYPNLMSAEGMRGQEWQAWHSGNSLDHNATLPFTRNLAGAMDFTPGIFDLRYHNTINKAAHSEDGAVDKEYDYKFFVNTTLAHQLAEYVVFYSPIQMVADLPQNYEEHYDALQFIRDVAVDWTESRCLDAKIGDYVVMARRAKGSDNWFVGGITDGTARTITLSFDFLDSDKSYRATIYRDGERAGWDSYPTDYTIETLDVDSTSSLDIRMAEGGGFAISIMAQ